MNSAHSILPPSGAGAWVACPLWATMNRRYPQESTPESLEGNAAHWVFAEMLTGRPVIEGALAPNGIFITEEMIEGGELVVDTVPKILTLHIEETLPISRIHRQCFGTPDIWAFDRQLMTLYLLDYKFGHAFVDEFENWQMIAYVAGIIDKLADEMDVGPGLLDQQIRVRATIIQPRCYHRGSPVRTWTFHASDIRPHVDKLMSAASKALGENPEAVTNQECGNCTGRHACQALQKAAYYDAEIAVKSPPVELPPAAAGLELKMLERSLERLQARVEGLREAVVTYIRQGHAVPWYRTEQGYGRQQWTLPAEQVIAMGELMGVDLSKTGVKTPKQAVKIGIDEAVIKGYSIIPLGSVKLIPDNPADARRVFGINRGE